jgi:SAM-dependent methyltransferase
MNADFRAVTELPDTPISREQLERLVNRYTWASSYCRGRDVVEAGCGIGPGLGMLAGVARSLEAGDYCRANLDLAGRHYNSRIRLLEFNAEAMPFADNSKDVIILFEAIYYLPQPERFLAECVRVLREGGQVLLATANKDLWDFHPSPYSHAYFGVVELGSIFAQFGFSCIFFGFQPVDHSPVRQRLLRPLKRAAVMSGIMPKTMKGKRWLKRIVFGRQAAMPAELVFDAPGYEAPQPIGPDGPDRRHKIIYCAATAGRKLA